MLLENAGQEPAWHVQVRQQALTLRSFGFVCHSHRMVKKWILSSVMIIS